ncbi:hypothetical protein [Aurantimonas coralicida]|uniref:hypothetical protein n=1 Tax=Aurantimonas coralicida TaxID=182270 RepID=UPI001D1974DA|nr:hypothetical protein [Aurantimonas coralicida]MCC4298418.1 hypothetical protein [Aurantimonas coralicida]
MGSIGKILAAIGRALRAGVVIAGEMSAATIDGIAALVAGIFRRRRQETEETIEVPDYAGEDAVEAVTAAVRKMEAEEKEAAPVSQIRQSIGERVQLACRRLEAWQPVGEPFAGMRAEAALMLYVGSLTEMQRKLILHRSPREITAHFKDGRTLPGIPSWAAFDPAAEHEKQRTAGWTWEDRYHDRREAILADGGDVDWHDLWFACQAEDEESGPASATGGRA